ncbi:MAG TPA: hypothetical protein VKE74_03320 [Gemmataceae bacterium]|nr:hypothetical protein [Gemmataceae bacterium]
MDRKTLEAIARDLNRLGDRFFGKGEVILADLAWAMAAETYEAAEWAADVTVTVVAAAGSVAERREEVRPCPIS